MYSLSWMDNLKTRWPLFSFSCGLLWVLFLKHVCCIPPQDHVTSSTHCLGIPILPDKNFSRIGVYGFPAPCPISFKAFESWAFSTTVNNQYHHLVFPLNFWGLLLNIVQLLRRAFSRIVYQGSCYPIGPFILNTEAENTDVSITSNVYDFKKH